MTKHEEEDIERFSIDDLYIQEDFVGQSSSKVYLTSDRSSPTDMHTETEPPPRNKGTARVIACVAITFIVVCFMMVGASLIMSKDIDSKGKLRKNKQTLSKYKGYF
jgi:hypothetical protein